MPLSFDHLKTVMCSYQQLSEECWSDFKEILREKSVGKNTVLIDFGEVPKYFYFNHKGFLRAYTISRDESVKEVNKNFFKEGRFPSSVIAALDQRPSEICIETLEDSIVVEIDHAKYRQLLNQHDDLKWYHIKYLEKHWVKEKEPLEISLLDGVAKKRYQDFREAYPKVVGRIPLYHLASRLGITPTQLSRIRKIKKS